MGNNIIFNPNLNNTPNLPQTAGLGTKQNKMILIEIKKEGYISK